MFNGRKHSDAESIILMLPLNLDTSCAFDILRVYTFQSFKFDKNWLDRTKDRKGTWG